MNDPGVIRNRAKIQATVNNARRFKEVQNHFGSFDTFIWKFVRGKTIDKALKTFANLPADSPESRLMSKELKERASSS